MKKYIIAIVFMVSLLVPFVKVKADVDLLTLNGNADFSAYGTCVSSAFSSSLNQFGGYTNSKVVPLLEACDSLPHAGSPDQDVSMLAPYGYTATSMPSSITLPEVCNSSKYGKLYCDNFVGYNSSPTDTTPAPQTPAPVTSNPAPVSQPPTTFVPPIQTPIVQSPVVLPNDSGQVATLKDSVNTLLQGISVLQQSNSSLGGQVVDLKSQVATLQKQLAEKNTPVVCPTVTPPSEQKVEALPIVETPPAATVQVQTQTEVHKGFWGTIGSWFK